MKKIILIAALLALMSSSYVLSDLAVFKFEIFGISKHFTIIADNEQAGSPKHLQMLLYKCYKLISYKLV